MKFNYLMLTLMIIGFILLFFLGSSFIKASESYTDDPRANLETPTGPAIVTPLETPQELPPTGAR